MIILQIAVSCFDIQMMVTVVSKFKRKAKCAFTIEGDTKKMKIIKKIGNLKIANVNVLRRSLKMLCKKN